MSPETAPDRGDAVGALPPSATRVVRWAADRGLRLQVREYPEDGARTAADAAAAVGCTVDQIVKSMIFDADGELVLALTSGGNQVDPVALAGIAGAGRCGRADPEAVRAATGYAIGGVPPFGHATALRTWVDPRLLTFDEVWAAAGTPRHVFPLAPQALVELTGAEPAPFTVGG
jgi:prolyl-tRNA editing enzyme YbaK/EbsC (Cys-tRNA(Pro) deacylase)